MRNLINFVVKHHLLLLFIGLELICFILIYRHSYYQQAGMFNSANYVSGKTFEAYNNISQYVNLKEENERLSAENAALRSLSVDAYIAIHKIKFDIDDTIYKQKYQWFRAKVLQNSTNKRNNYLTLDRGTLLGVKPEMAVTSTTGIVGIVKDVSPHYSSVMSILHKDAHISAQHKNTRYFGALTWDGKDYTIADLNDLPKHVPIKIGDTITTSYHSTIFPEGLMIGTIQSFEKEAADTFYKIKVKLSTNYKNLTNVYIIENIFKTEQDTLEQKQQGNVK